MKVYKILYSRTSRDDYRWILQPPNEQIKGELRDGVWKQFRSVARRYVDPGLPFLFGYAFDGGILVARCWETKETDYTGRPIQALEGIYGLHQQRSVIAAMSYAVVGCHDVALSILDEKYNRTENKECIENVDFDQLNELFWQRYSRLASETVPDRLPIRLTYDEQGFAGTISHLLNFWRFGFRSFAFGLPPDIDWSFDIVAPLVEASGKSKRATPLISSPPSKSIAEIMVRPASNYVGKSLFVLQDLFTNAYHENSDVFDLKQSVFGGYQLKSAESYSKFDEFLDRLKALHWRVRSDRGTNWWSVRLEKTTSDAGSA
ncbi:MAG TPA: hypothetical protein VGJ73_18920 [Verrucomicrobiae bacterium]|jgi:hypothetical protein